jgi:hypothetical protein
MAMSGFGAAQAIRRDSAHVRLSGGTGWLKYCVPNTLARCYGSPRGLAASLLAIGLLLPGMWCSRAETYA